MYSGMYGRMDIWILFRMEYEWTLIDIVLFKGYHCHIIVIWTILDIWIRIFLNTAQAQLQLLPSAKSLLRTELPFKLLHLPCSKILHSLETVCATAALIHLTDLETVSCENRRDTVEVLKHP